MLLLLLVWLFLPFGITSSSTHPPFVLAHQGDELHRATLTKVPQVGQGINASLFEQKKGANGFAPRTRCNLIRSEQSFCIGLRDL